MSELNKSSAVCAVVVTFNRKELLMECLKGLLEQSRPLDAILIVDNASTDGTPELLLENGYLPELPCENNTALNMEYNKKKLSLPIGNFGNRADSDEFHEQLDLDVYYVRMHENTGGAGGFFEGVKRGYELGFDWLWLMDDDGLPKYSALESLLHNKKNLNFLNPLVIDKDNKYQLSFGLYSKKFRKNIKNVNDAFDCSEDGLIYDTANPFNGTFISKELIEKIGYPKKEMFIWGDEVEYQQRASESGMGLATVVDAIHYHPRGRVETVGILGNRYRLNYQTTDLKNYCDMRNKAYLYARHKRKKQLFKLFLAYSYFFMTELKLIGYAKYLEATFDGIFAVWGKEKRFLK